MKNTTLIFSTISIFLLLFSGCQKYEPSSQQSDQGNTIFYTTFNSHYVSAEELIQQGYSNLENDLPIELQLEAILALKEIIDKNGQPEYIFYTSKVQGTTLEEAQQKATGKCLMGLAQEAYAYFETQEGVNLLATRGENTTVDLPEPFTVLTLQKPVSEEAEEVELITVMCCEASKIRQKNLMK